MINFLWESQTGNNVETKDWFSQYGYIILIILSVILVAGFIFMLVLFFKVRHSEKNKAVNDEKNKILYYEALGGESNVLGVESKGSRLVIRLKDYSLMNEDKLKELGLDSSLKATDKITFIVGQKASEIASILAK